MRLNNFSVRVLNFTEREGGYVPIPHGKQYALAIANHTFGRCDAHVKADGKHVGTWRLTSHQTITINGPVTGDDRGLFTFYAVDSQEGQAIGLNRGNPEMGLITVTFTPEKVQPVRPIQPKVVWDTARYYGSGETYTYGETYNLSSDVPLSTPRSGVSSRAGGTGLSGFNDKDKWRNAEEMDLDYSAQVTIHLRLIADDSGPRPLQAAATPIPPPVF